MAEDGFSDLAFFAQVARKANLAAAAQQLGITPSAVSKRLAMIERRLGVRLMNRTTRYQSLTPEGESYLTQGAKVLEGLDTLERGLAGRHTIPKGVLRVCATFGFGRRHLAPALADFAVAYPQVEVQLHLTDRPVNLAEQGFDALLRFGELPDARLTASRLALNRRVLCASPAYLQKKGVPAKPQDLSRHDCIFIRESDETFGTWYFSRGVQQETVKVRGPLSTNDGESALAWALAGHGILVRSLWDVAALLRSGQLQPLLIDWQLPGADIYLVFEARKPLAARTRALVDFLMKRFEPCRVTGDPVLGPW